MYVLKLIVPLPGLFADSHLPYEADRAQDEDNGNPDVGPSLSDMAAAAINRFITE